MGQYNAESEKRRNVVGSRLAQLRNSRELSLDAFQKILTGYGVDVSRSAINRWELGKTTPSAYHLLAICQALDIEDVFSAFMSCSKREALNAEGLRKLSGYRDDLLATGLYTRREEPEAMDYMEMPVSCLAASAGTGEFLEEGGFEMTRVPAGEVPDGAQFGVRLNGDSMEPFYHDGQIVWVKPCSSLRPGDVGLFTCNGDGFVKSYSTRMPSEENLGAFTDSEGRVREQPVMVSFNARYDPIVITPEMDFRIVGKVL